MTRTPLDLAAVCVASALALAACGGSKAHSGSSGTPASGAKPAATQPLSSQGGARTSTQTSGSETQQGGGSEPVRAPATLTGRGGRITPTSVRVPPFIAVEISLTSADGRTYGLSVAGRTISVSAGRRNASVRLPGLRPGSSYDARPAGGGATISITPSAEPGP